MVFTLLIFLHIVIPFKICFGTVVIFTRLEQGLNKKGLYKILFLHYYWKAVTNNICLLRKTIDGASRTLNVGVRWVP